MPFYEYECSACKYYVEALQKISDPPLIKCPSCGRDTLQRLLSAPVFRLKGSGWYETDFKSEKEQKRNIAGEAEAAGPEKKEGEDSKPAVRARKKSRATATTDAGQITKKSAAAATPKPRTTAKKSAKKPAKKPARKTAKKSAAKSAVKKAPPKQRAGKTKVVKKTAKKPGKRKVAKKK